MGEGANDLVRNDTGTTENFLELDRCCGALTCRQVRDSAQVNRVQIEVQSAGPIGITTLVDSSRREVLEGRGRAGRAGTERNGGTNHGQVFESHQRIFGKTAGQIIGGSPRTACITAEANSDGSHGLNVLAV